MTDAERQQLGSVVDDLFRDFLDVVERGRPRLARADVERLADGRVFSARQALAAGLVDGIGDVEQAIEQAKSAAHVQGDARVVVYRRSGERAENLFSVRAPIGMADASAAQLRSALAESNLLYWWPGGVGASVVLDALGAAARASVLEPAAR
jgi:protease-4